MSLPDAYRKPEKGDRFPALSLSRSLMESLTELRVKLAARSPRHFSVSALTQLGLQAFVVMPFLLIGIYVYFLPY